MVSLLFYIQFFWLCFTGFGEHKDYGFSQNNIKYVPVSQHPRMTGPVVPVSGEAPVEEDWLPDILSDTKTWTRNSFFVESDEIFLVSLGRVRICFQPWGQSLAVWLGNNILRL